MGFASGNNSIARNESGKNSARSFNAESKGVNFDKNHTRVFFSSSEDWTAAP